MRNFLKPMPDIMKNDAKVLYGNSEKSFLQCEKNGFISACKEDLPALPPRDFFLIQFEINLRKLLVQFQLFEKLIRVK